MPSHPVYSTFRTLSCLPCNIVLSTGGCAPVQVEHLVPRRRSGQLADLAHVAALHENQRLVQGAGIALQKAPQASRLLEGI